MLSTSGLIDATSSITNDIVLNSLAHEEGFRTREYIIDFGKVPSLDFRRELGGDNYQFQIKLSYKPEAEIVLGPYGPSTPDDRPVSALSVPVTLYENGRLTYARLEVKVWRA